MEIIRLAEEDIDDVSKNFILVRTLWDSANILHPSPSNSIALWWNG